MIDELRLAKALHGVSTTTAINLTINAAGCYTGPKDDYPDRMWSLAPGYVQEEFLAAARVLLGESK